MKKLTIGSLKPGSTTTYIQTNGKNRGPSTPAKKQLEIEQHNSQYKVSPMKNRTVLDASLYQNMNIDHKCKKGTCGKCQVKVLKGDDLITSVTVAEQKKLGEKIDDGYRLACQSAFK